MLKYEWLGHSSLKFIYKEKIIIYIDPYNIKNHNQDANYIFITHSHYDHYSEDDIKKIVNNDTKIIITKDLKEKILKLGIDNSKIQVVLPNSQYKFGDISFSTIIAYNLNKFYHPKENNWVGYIINLDKIVYIAGDTDITEENKNVKCDVAFLPVGGTYTMDAYEAAHLANIIKPKLVYPIHYGSIVGTKEDAISFINNVDHDIDKKLLNKKKEVI